MEKKTRIVLPCRGDIVMYHGRHYFFQPLGNRAVLYDDPKKIGNYDSAITKPQKSSVFFVKSDIFVTSEDIAAIKNGKCIKIYDSEDSTDECTNNKDVNLIEVKPKEKARKEEIDALWQVIELLSFRLEQLELRGSNSQLNNSNRNF
jgi:hypothetical protein